MNWHIKSMFFRTIGILVTAVSLCLWLPGMAVFGLFKNLMSIWPSAHKGFLEGCDLVSELVGIK